MKTFEKLSLYYNTLKYLRFEQVKYRIFYFFRAKWQSLISFRHNYDMPFPKHTTLKLATSVYTSTDMYLGEKTFCFLNLEKRFSDNINWDFGEFGKLWTYNLNYFEFLNQKNIRIEDVEILMTDFVEKLPNLKNANEPFPTSLRIIFWIRFLVNNKTFADSNKEIIKSLYAQIQILDQSIEFHLYGNHLLENAFALLHAAYFFNDKKIYKKAKKILLIELEEQILADGGHFELSPMYHQLMLYRILDCVNLVKNNPTLFGGELLPTLEFNASKMLSWLRQMTFRNGQIPMFNDAADNIAPASQILFEYAARLNIQSTSIALKESGYRKFSNKFYELIADVGNIGPNYLPGHAHSDTLNFELYIQDTPFIVEVGTSTYQNNDRRAEERSTSSHNTVEINGREQSEVWGAFRVAKRAKATIITENNLTITATHDGYRKIKARHERKFTFGTRSISINDYVCGASTAKAFFFFHPQVLVNLQNNKIQNLNVTLSFEGAEKIELCGYDYAVGFNKLEKGQKVTIHFTKHLLTTISIVNGE